MDSRNRHGQSGKNCKAAADYDQKKRDDGERFVRCEAGKGRLDGVEQFSCAHREKHRDENETESDASGRPKRRGHAH